MSFVESNFFKHGHTDFTVWLNHGDTTCAAFVDGDRITVGFLRTDDWKAVQWNPDKAELLRDSLQFLQIYDVRIVKSGWFAFATVDFTVALGQVMRGKTDKKFAEFLVSISDRFNQRVSPHFLR